MASSKKLPKNSLTTNPSAAFYDELKHFLKQFFRQHQLARPALLIAYSGGLDSTVLLHALRHLQSEIPFHLSAMHIHHGLSGYADDWANFCSETALQLNVPIQIVQVTVDQQSGKGIEAAARHARYQALNTVEADFIFLGHHQDDQAETFLLQLARGAGVKGLAGMAKVDIERRLIRPLLDFKREQLVAYAKTHHLEWIEDESNVDERFDRNFMRHTLIPTFNEKYTEITKTLARSAQHMSDASALLDDLAILDAEDVVDVEKKHSALRLTALHALSVARQRNLIRWWLAENQIAMPSSALLEQLVEQLKSTRTDAAIKVKVADRQYVMRYQQRAFLVPEQDEALNLNLLWQGEDVLVLPDSSRLLFTKKMGCGFAFERGGGIELHIKSRSGGERFKPDINRPRRSLKSVMQSRGIPPWLRERCPLVFMGGTLVIIPNIGVDADMQAEPHEMGLSIRWEPNAH